MAAITETRRQGGGLGCLLCIAAIIALLILLGQEAAVMELEIPDVGSVETGDHAVQRHGSDAELVRRELAAGGGSQYDCKDGKQYIIKRLHDGRWALMVVRDGREVTSFITTQSYIQSSLENDDCTNGWSHP